MINVLNIIQNSKRNIKLGTKLYSPMYGDMILWEVPPALPGAANKTYFICKGKTIKENTYCIKREIEVFVVFDEFGRFGSFGECCIFPDRNKTWDKYLEKQPGIWKYKNEFYTSEYWDFAHDRLSTSKCVFGDLDGDKRYLVYVPKWDKCYWLCDTFYKHGSNRHIALLEDPYVKEKYVFTETENLKIVVKVKDE